MNEKIQSSINQTALSVGNNRRSFVSTIPLVQWISANQTAQYPFRQSTFQNITQSTITSTQTSNFTSTVNEIGNFGTTQSNIQPPCSDQTQFSTVPVTTSSITSTFSSTIPFIFTSTAQTTFGILGSTTLASTSQLVDFTSTGVQSPWNTGSTIQTPTVWLGEGLEHLIDTRQQNVFVDYRQSLLLKNTASQTWVSTIGIFGSQPLSLFGYTGRTATTRVGTNVYSDVSARLMYAAQPTGTSTELAPGQDQNSNFGLSLNFISTNTGSNGTDFDIYIPGQNNFTFTCVPITSTLLNGV